VRWNSWKQKGWKGTLTTAT